MVSSVVAVCARAYSCLCNQLGICAGSRRHIFFFLFYGLGSTSVVVAQTSEEGVGGEKERER